MYALSVIGLSISLVFISIITQKTEAQNCSDTNVQSCLLAYNNVKSQAVQDKNKICSAGNIYLQCLNKVSPDCDVDETITEARKELSQNGCVSKPFSLARKSKKKKKKKDGDDDDDDGDDNNFFNMEGYETDDIFWQGLDLVEETKDKGNIITQITYLYQFYKVSGAGSIHLNLAVIGSGLTFYSLV